MEHSERYLYIYNKSPVTCHHGRVRPLVLHSLPQQAAICPGLCFDELLHKVVDHCQLSR